MKVRRSTNAIAILLFCILSATGQTHPSQPSGGSPELPKLEVGIAVERTIGGGDRHLYRLELSKGEFVRVEAVQKNCNIILALDSPAKTALFEFKDDSFRDGPEVQTAAVPATGTYTLKVVSFEDAAQKGSYSVKVSEIRPATDKELSQTAGFEITSNLSKVEKGSLTAEQNRQMITQYEQALEKFRFAGSRKWEAVAISSIGSGYTRLGNWSKAIELQRQAIDIQRSIGEDKDIVFLLTNLGNTYLHNGEPQKSLEVLAEAANLATLRGDPYNESLVLGSIGKVHEDSGDVERALTFYTRSLERAEKSGQDLRVAVSLNSLGTANSIKGENTKAVEFFTRAIDLSRRAKHKRLESALLSNLAQALVSLGEVSKAEVLLGEALTIARSLTDKMDEASVMRQIAAIRLKVGKPDEAIELLNRSREIYRAIESPRNLANTLLLLGKAHAQKGEMVTALDNASAAVELIEKTRAGLKATELRDAFSVELQTFYSFYIEVLMARHLAEPDKNFAALAFQASESARARGLISLLAESNTDIRKNVDKALLQREVELRDLLSARLENLTKILSGKAAETAGPPLKNEIEEIRTQYERVQEQIRAASPRYAALTQPRTLSLAEVQSEVLDADSVLLEYSLGKTKSFLWVVTKTGFRSVELPPAAVIENTSRQFYESLTARNKDIKFETPAERDFRIARADKDVEKYSRELAAITLDPVAQLLAGKKVLIVADGALQYVPFAALKMSGITNDVRFLAESNEIVNLPSASALAVLRKETKARPPAGKTLVVIADPIFDKEDERFQAIANKNRSNPKPDSKADLVAASKRRTRSAGDGTSRDGLDLTRLPFTRREAELISAVVPQGQKEKWLDFEANRRLATSAQLSNYRYVHFATHGFINDENPELSGLVFSMVDENGKDQDGFLRQGDIYDLKLPAEMVVLSGCRTGLGKAIKGEGVVGMTRAFMYAGAKRVTVSLWDINDEATSELMGDLYREMFASRRASPAVALRKAQMAMIRDKRWSNPYFWATFVIQGEPN